MASSDRSSPDEPSIHGEDEDEVVGIFSPAEDNSSSDGPIREGRRLPSLSRASSSHLAPTVAQRQRLRRTLSAISAQLLALCRRQAHFQREAYPPPLSPPPVAPRSLPPPVPSELEGRSGLDSSSQRRRHGNRRFTEEWAAERAARLGPNDVQRSLERLQAWLVSLVAHGGADAAEILTIVSPNTGPLPHQQRIQSGSESRSQDSTNSTVSCLAKEFCLATLAAALSRIANDGGAVAVVRATRELRGSHLESLLAAVAAPPSPAGRLHATMTLAYLSFQQHLLISMVDALVSLLVELSTTSIVTTSSGASASVDQQLSLLSAAGMWRVSLLEGEGRAAAARVIRAATEVVLPRVKSMVRRRQFCNAIQAFVQQFHRDMPTKMVDISIDNGFDNDMRGDVSLLLLQSSSWEELLLSIERPLDVLWTAEERLATVFSTWIKISGSSKKSLVSAALAALVTLLPHAPPPSFSTSIRQRVFTEISRAVKTALDSGNNSSNKKENLGTIALLKIYLAGAPRCYVHQPQLKAAWDVEAAALLAAATGPPSTISFLQEELLEGIADAIAALGRFHGDLHVGLGAIKRLSLAGGASRSLGFRALANLLAQLRLSTMEENKSALLMRRSQNEGSEGEPVIEEGEGLADLAAAVQVAAEIGLDKTLLEFMSSYVATFQAPSTTKLKKNSKAYHKAVDDMNSMKYALRCLSIFLAEAASCGGGVRLATLHILGKILLNPTPSLRPEALESLIANRELLSPELALTGLRLLLRKAARLPLADPVEWTSILDALWSFLKHLDARIQEPNADGSSREIVLGWVEHKPHLLDESVKVRVKLEAAALLAVAAVPDKDVHTSAEKLMKTICDSVSLRDLENAWLASVMKVDIVEPPIPWLSAEINDPRNSIGKIVMVSLDSQSCVSRFTVQVHWAWRKASLHEPWKLPDECSDREKERYNQLVWFLCTCPRAGNSPTHLGRAVSSMDERNIAKESGAVMWALKPRMCSEAIASVFQGCWNTARRHSGLLPALLSVHPSCFETLIGITVGISHPAEDETSTALESDVLQVLAHIYSSISPSDFWTAPTSPALRKAIQNVIQFWLSASLTDRHPLLRKAVTTARLHALQLLKLFVEFRTYGNQIESRGVIQPIKEDSVPNTPLGRGAASSDLVNEAERENAMSSGASMALAVEFLWRESQTYSGLLEDEVSKRAMSPAEKMRTFRAATGPWLRESGMDPRLIVSVANMCNSLFANSAGDSSSIVEMKLHSWATLWKDCFGPVGSRKDHRSPGAKGLETSVVDVDLEEKATKWLAQQLSGPLAENQSVFESITQALSSILKRRPSHLRRFLTFSLGGESEGLVADISEASAKKILQEGFLTAILQWAKEKNKIMIEERHSRQSRRSRSLSTSSSQRKKEDQSSSTSLTEEFYLSKAKPIETDSANSVSEEGDGMYVCLFHLASPSPAIRALASELLATFAYSWWNGETKPSGSLSLPPAAAAEAPPEAHLKAANEISELLAATPSSKLWTVSILREAVALHSLLPTTTLPVALTILQPWVALYPEIVQANVGSQAVENDKAKGGVSVIRFLFHLTSLCGWPCSHSALLSRLWQKLIEDDSLRLCSNAINLLADLLMENLTMAQSIESKRYAPMCLSFLVSSNSGNANGIIHRILTKNIRNFENLDRSSINVASNVSDDGIDYRVVAWDNCEGLSDGDVNMRELAAISLLMQIAHDHTATLKFCLPILIHVAVVLASHPKCPPQSRRQIVAFLAFACVGLTDSEDSTDCKNFLSQFLANAENANGPILCPKGISALVQVFKAAIPSFAHDWALIAEEWALRSCFRHDVLQSLTILTALPVDFGSMASRLQNVGYIVMACIHSRDIRAAKETVALIRTLGDAAAKMDDKAAIQSVVALAAAALCLPLCFPCLRRYEIALDVEKPESLTYQILLLKEMVFGERNNMAAAGVLWTVAATPTIPPDVVAVVTLFKWMASELATNCITGFWKNTAVALADDLPVDNCLLLAVILSGLIKMASVQSGVREHQPRCIVAFIDACGYSLHDISQVLLTYPSYPHEGNIGTGENPFFTSFVHAFGLCFPGERAWHVALAICVGFVAAGPMNWKISALNLALHFLSAHSHAWPRTTFLMVAALLESAPVIFGSPDHIDRRFSEPVEIRTDGSAELAILEEMRSFLIEQAPFDISHKVFDALRPLRERLKASAGHGVSSSSRDHDSAMNEISIASPRGTFECPLKPCEEILLSAMELAEIRDHSSPIESLNGSATVSPPTHSQASISPSNGHGSAASFVATSPALTTISHASSQSFIPHSSVGPPKLAAPLAVPHELASSCVKKWLTQLIGRSTEETTRYLTLPVDNLRFGIISLAQSEESACIDIEDGDEGSSRTSTQGEHKEDSSTKEKESDKQVSLQGEENKEVAISTSEDEDDAYHDAVVYERWTPEFADEQDDGTSVAGRSLDDNTNPTQSFSERQPEKTDAAAIASAHNGTWLFDDEDQVHQNDDGTFHFL